MWGVAGVACGPVRQEEFVRGKLRRGCVRPCAPVGGTISAGVGGGGAKVACGPVRQWEALRLIETVSASALP